MHGTTNFVPKKGCTHAYGMMFEADFCACRKCGDRWVMTEKGWRAVPRSWKDGDDVESTPTRENPYARYSKPKGARLKPKAKR